jgi:hypothetical protein
VTSETWITSQEPPHLPELQLSIQEGQQQRWREDPDFSLLLKDSPSWEGHWPFLPVTSALSSHHHLDFLLGFIWGGRILFFLEISGFRSASVRIWISL